MWTKSELNSSSHLCPVIHFLEKKSVPTQMDEIQEISDSIRWIFKIWSTNLISDLTEMDEFHRNLHYLDRIPKTLSQLKLGISPFDDKRELKDGYEWST